MKVGLLNSFKINSKNNFDTILNNNLNIYQSVSMVYRENAQKFT